MENRGDSESQKQQSDDPKEKNTSFVVKIPSYEEVAESSQPKSQSLFNPSTSFSQAFNFIKNSEFYTTPPSALSAQPSKDSFQGPHARGPIQSEVPSASTSSAGANRNAILVSHRQMLGYSTRPMRMALHVLIYASSSICIGIRPIQDLKGNPLLKHIRNVRWVFADIVCDYLLGQNSCALYLSLRYHLLHPDYLYFRIRELQKNFKLRVVLCHVDVEDVVKPLLEVTKTALLHDCTLLCGWSLEECGRYLETIKVYENKPADLIQGQMDMDYMSRLNHALTSVRHVNKTDAVTLGSTFGSLSNIMDASMEDLARCPGIGEKKVKRLHDTFHEPFKRAVPDPAVRVAVDSNAGATSESKRNEGVEENQETSKGKKKEEEISVKSALKAAFAKYSGTTGSKRKAVVADEENARSTDKGENATR